ncbi:hypothetical protein MMC07_003981 [Pseudocyphellaria aurata]|nr:hypothetical protein [Pseudocyphellaria aurata]
MSSSYFPQQPSLASAQEFVPPPPPYTPYQPSCPQQQPQVSSLCASLALLPPFDSLRSVAGQNQQYQQHEAQAFSTGYHANAPPTPVYTPNSQSQGFPSAAQYFPPPPQSRPNFQQPPFDNGSQPVFNQPPVNAPPTPAFTPAPHDSSGQHSGDPNHQTSAAPTAEYFPLPPQNQHQQQPIGSGSQPAYNSPPFVYSQAPEALQVQSTYSQSTVNIQSNPPSTSQLYSGPGQFPQSPYPPEKVQYQQQQLQPQQFPQSPYPPEKVQYQQQQQQTQQQPQIILVGQQQGFGNPLVSQTQQSVIPALPPVSEYIPPGASSGTPAKDDLKSSKTKRFFGDTLVGRAARSSVSTVTSTVKLPASLSPWGDNNPVTLPNVRYRDAALFATFHVIGGPLVDGVGNLVTDTFGADTFVSEVVNSGAGFINGNTVVKYGVFQIVEQAIDKGVLEKVLPEVEKTMRTTSAKSLQVAIKHKLMGVEADLRFVGAYPATSLTACDKGWFCPYLYASSREPVVSRAQDFAIAQFFGPYVTADTALTHKLLTESASVIPLCDPNPTLRIPHSRLLVLFTGITPFRAGMWSTSRRPGCGQLNFHLLNGCPALVLPVRTADTPVLAWSPWTLSQMQQSQTSGSYKPETHHRQITDWLMQLVDRPGLYPCVRDTHGAFERLMSKVVTMIINGAMAVPRSGDKLVFGKLDAERAGVVMLRY